MLVIEMSLVKHSVAVREAVKHDFAEALAVRVFLVQPSVPAVDLLHLSAHGSYVRYQNTVSSSVLSNQINFNPLLPSKRT